MNSVRNRVITLALTGVAIMLALATPTHIPNWLAATAITLWAGVATWTVIDAWKLAK